MLYKDVKVYCVSKGTETSNGETTKDRIYFVINDIKPSDRKDIKYTGKGLYELTDPLIKMTASDALEEWQIKYIANELNRTSDEISNFRVDYLSTNVDGYFKVALAAEDELWRNRKKNNRSDIVLESVIPLE